ncbi:MAG: isoleucine--tRNA ligase [Candidatus Thermoplasmatota archaeon]|nr:isoleucine--tRNA ligase [Candidatus Thermoplasmatota archaeon]
MVRQASGKYDFKALERKIANYWAENNIYEKVKKKHERGKDYYFIDGPPYTSGSVHLGTAWNKIIKDVVIRYLRMNNFNVRDQPGYDMHGLPIEVQVEKTLNIRNKKEIETFGVERFVSKCKEFALECMHKMTSQFSALGVWLDWNKPYLTITNNYIESAWWTLKKAYGKQLLFRALRVLTWCPRCETALADAEIEYWDEKDYSIYVKFKLRDRAGFLLVWTTTPWTLPANLAVAVHPEFNYVEAKFDDRDTLILVEERLEDVMRISNYERYQILKRYKGRDIEGLDYIHPLAEEVPIHKDRVHKVILADFVTSENTGLVHIAPGHGEEDFEAGEKYGLEPLSLVLGSGSFDSQAGKYAGLNIKDANSIIIEDLKRKNLLLASDYVIHRYGHCWRCSTPIIYRATKQWFLKVTAVKEKMLEELEKVKWYPEWAGLSRFKEWVSSARDWCISRQRYWGIPLPIWVCEKCSNLKIVTSREELGAQELHRPWIDKVILECDKCRANMLRVNDVVDVWLDSAVCSWAQLNYPKNNEEFSRWWPCEFITEAHDQTRGWFYSQLVASVIALNRAPYRTVLVHGWALDEKGVAMSKSLGNVITPEEVIEKYGTDALRFYLLSNSPVWEDQPFSWDGVRNANRMLNMLWNVYVFATTYMALDKFENLDINIVQEHLKPEDRWLLSRVESLKQVFNDEFKNYNLHKVCRAIEKFVLDDLSRWYVRLVRDRTWLEEKTNDKIAVYKTLYEALITTTKLLAPVVPFVSDEIYLNMCGNLGSVHLESWPKVDESIIDKTLESQVALVREVTETVASARQKANIKLRYPIKRVVVKTSAEVANALKSLESMLLDQTNSKNLEFGEITEKCVSLNFTYGTVYIDTEITPELKLEGLARELVRRIQTMRKELNLNVEDYIEVWIEASATVTNACEKWLEYIRRETRSETINFKSMSGLVKVWDIDGEKVTLGVKKSPKS